MIVENQVFSKSDQLWPGLGTGLIFGFVLMLLLRVHGL